MPKKSPASAALKEGTPESSLSKILLTAPRSTLSKDDFVIKEEDQILFQAFIRQLPTSIVIFDTEMRYIIASDTFLRTLNIPIRDVIGKRHYDLVPDLPKKWRDLHQRGLRGEHLSSEEDAYRRADGTVEWWKWEILPWYKSGGVIGGIILFVEDITKRKLMEKQMKEMIKTLNRSIEDLERFAHICAHDLNEPLRTIGSYCHIIQKEFSKELSPGAKAHFVRITKSVKQMNELINGILTYSQVGKDSLKKEICSTQDIMLAIQWMLEGRIRDKSAIISFNALPQVYADKILLTCVFQNLISNALKFNNSKVPVVRITAKETKKWWIFFVEDNGIGIEEVHRKVIFDLFKRLHAPGDYEGTGIGLSFCKKIIEAHGGEIVVKSVPQKGACFSFKLPKKGSPSFIIH